MKCERHEKMAEAGGALLALKLVASASRKSGRDDRLIGMGDTLP